MKRNTLLTLAAVALAAAPLYAQREEARRASIRGGGGDGGKCTIEVDVDDVAEVVISGDMGRLRTLSGQPAFWRRFECTGPLPANPGDFRFSGVDGRGRQTLVTDPRSSRGAAVIRIEDPKGGREGYTFDIEWRGGSNYGGGNFGGGGGNWGGRGAGQALADCQDAVRAKADREYGVRDLNFLGGEFDNNRGRRDFISGAFESRRGRERFQFSCSVDFDSGRVRSVDIMRADGVSSYGNDAGRACQDAVVDRLQGDGYSGPNFRTVNQRNNTVTGSVTARDRYGNSNFDFSCTVDSRGGIRNVDVVRR